MKTTRWIGSVAIVAAAYGMAIGAAWSADAPATTSTPPGNTVSNDDDSKNSKDSQDSKSDTAATKPAPTKSQTKPKSDDDKNGDFKPSEEISEDMSVAYPSDI